MTDQKKQEIEKLAAAAHRLREINLHLSMQNTETEPEKREKQVIAKALADAELFDAERALASVLYK